MQPPSSAHAAMPSTLARSMVTSRSVPRRTFHPAVVRFVWRRDHGRCQTPGCRSARGLEIHHIVHRTDGGSHDPSNLTLRCSACHQNHHAGSLIITGTAPDRLEVQRREEPAAEAATKLDMAMLRAQARDALVALGWKPAIARAAVDDAASHMGHDASLEQLIREALRRCPRPIVSS